MLRLREGGSRGPRRFLHGLRGAGGAAPLGWMDGDGISRLDPPPTWNRPNWIVPQCGGPHRRGPSHALLMSLARLKALAQTLVGRARKRSNRGGENRPVVDADPLQSSIDSDLPELTESMYLVGRAQAGDREALDNLLGRYQDRLRRIVRVRLGPNLSGHVEIMDIVQETCAVAARRIEHLELHSPASILQWLSRIAENKIRDAYDYHFAQKRDRRRDRRIDPQRDDESTAAHPALQGSTTMPDERAWKKELREILDEALSLMPEDQREVILQRDYCGADWEHVARQLDRPNVHAVQELHRRAWIRLRRLVKPKLGGLLS